VNIFTLLSPQKTGSNISRVAPSLIILIMISLESGLEKPNAARFLSSSDAAPNLPSSKSAHALVK
jgi:hypothetical protein